MKGLKKRRSMVISVRLKDLTGCVTVNSLAHFSDIPWKFSQMGVTIVQIRKNKMFNEQIKLWSHRDNKDSNARPHSHTRS